MLISAFGLVTLEWELFSGTYSQKTVSLTDCGFPRLKCSKTRANTRELAQTVHTSPRYPIDSLYFALRDREI